MTPRTLIGFIFATFLLAGCSGALSVSPGDALTPPQLEPPDLEVIVLAADDLVSITSEVRSNGEIVEPGVSGTPTLTWDGTPITLEVEAPGFESWTFTVEEYPEAGQIEFRLEPVVLSGIVTTDSGRPLPGAKVELGASNDITDNEGRFALDRAVPGDILVTRPAWQDATFPWDGEVAQLDMSVNPQVINALRVSAEDILENDRWQKVLSLADVTAVNAVVIDLKTEDGTVVYPTEVEVANAIGAVSSYFDARDVLVDAQSHDLYTIARIGVFQDDFLAAAQPDAAVLSEDGSLWRSRNGFAWLDPSDPASYGYSIELAEEACRLGFDEIQFDYVSYPFGGDVSTATFDGAYNQEVRVASIAAFLNQAYAALNPLRTCTVSTTILGIVLESSADEGVGQRPGTMSRIVDVLSPTLYSTNYGPGWKGYEDPNAFAVEIVDTALDGGRAKLDGHGYLRPWLQTWTISAADQRAVQSVATDAGLGWMLWSNNASYSADALPPR